MEKVHLVGYSMGGWIACGVAEHHPVRLLSLLIGMGTTEEVTSVSLPPGEHAGDLSWDSVIGSGIMEREDATAARFWRSTRRQCATAGTT